MARLTVAGHSVHAIINDWPIALFSTSLVFDVLHLLTRKRVFAEASYYMMASGYATGLAAAASGIADYKAIERTGPVKRLADRHAVLNSVIMGLMTIGLAGRRRDKARVRPLPFALSAVANALTFVSAWYGDEMVYGHGVRVRDGRLKPGDRDFRLPGDEKAVRALYAGI